MRVFLASNLGRYMPGKVAAARNYEPEKRKAHLPERRPPH